MFPAFLSSQFPAKSRGQQINRFIRRPGVMIEVGFNADSYGWETCTVETCSQQVNHFSVSHEMKVILLQACSLDTVRNFLSVHDFGFALEFPKEPGRREVLWSDVRYCREDRPASARADCALWFGGEFEQGGRALRQETYVGDWIQQRPPPR